MKVLPLSLPLSSSLALVCSQCRRTRVLTGHGWRELENWIHFLKLKIWQLCMIHCALANQIIIIKESSANVRATHPACSLSGTELLPYMGGHHAHCDRWPLAHSHQKEMRPLINHRSEQIPTHLGMCPKHLLILYNCKWGLSPFYYYTLIVYNFSSVCAHRFWFPSSIQEYMLPTSSFAVL